MGDVVRAGDDRGYAEAISMEQELFACCDGEVYPITNWFDADAQPCAKENAAIVVAGRCFVWFAIPLANFGIGPLAESVSPMLSADEGDLCGVNGCTGTFQFQPPTWDWDGAGCSCHIAPPCGWCIAHELRCTDCNILPEEIEAKMEPLVSLDTDDKLCNSDTPLLRINPELHFPIGEVFEVPDEFNGQHRGTHYYRNGRGFLRGPFMSVLDAQSHLEQQEKL